MEIKVKNTKIHVAIPLGKSMHHYIPVTEAKLVLVSAKEDAVLAFNQYRGEYYIIPNKGDRLKMPCSYLKPILISETEKIEEGEWSYSIFHGSVFQSNFKDGPSGGHKVLALPEHFSKEQLNMIVEGKLKDGDKVYVECKDFCDYEGEESWEITPDFRIKSPLSIYPIEEKLYTREEVKLIVRRWEEYMWNYPESRRNAEFYQLEKWFETNVK